MINLGYMPRRCSNCKYDDTCTNDKKHWKFVCGLWEWYIGEEHIIREPIRLTLDKT